MVEKVIANLDSSKVSGPDCIPVVILKNWEPELSYILDEIFNMCLKKSPRLLESLIIGPCTLLVFFLWSIKSEKLVNNRIVDHPEKCGILSDFQYGFSSSRSTADILTVVSDRIARPF